MDTSEIIEFLKETADDDLKLEELNFDSPDAEIKFLMGRNKNPFIRNLMRPIGEFYAVITFDQNHILKLTKKPKWGGYVVCLVMWDFIIIDIDNHKDYSAAKRQLLNSYPNDLFYTHRTPRGFHIYLMSRLLECHNLDAIFMRMTANSDPAHATNSMYSGTSIRVCRKPSNTEDPSVFYEKFGNGNLDSYANCRYELCLKYLNLFSSFYTDKLLTTPDAGQLIYRLNTEMFANRTPDDFGLHHVLSMAPFKLTLDQNGRLSIVYNQQYCPRDPKVVWRELCENLTFPHDQRTEIIAAVHRKIQMRNLYRIISSTDEYAIGIHVQESLYFISYKNLLMVDYDTVEDLQYLRDYVAVSQEPLIFRIVKTKRGFHCFLTNKKVRFDSDEAYWILRNTKSDLFHTLGSLIRGYSVRLNKKHLDGENYEEVEILRSPTANEDEIPELVDLYQMHLKLYQKYTGPEYCTYNSAKSNSVRLFEMLN